MRVPQQQRQKYLRAFQGATFAIGSPIGWIIIRTLQGIPPRIELENNYGIYFYLLFGSMLTFIVFGYIIGKHEDILETLSILDPLTDLYNRRYFRARLNEEYAIAKRYNRPISLAILDLDKFKSINDRFGHPVGDKVLIAAANAIVSVVRQGETVSRIGGEEFAILLPDCESEVAFRVVERVRKAINDSYIDLDDGERITIKASAGISCVNNFDETNGPVINYLYEKADEALYEAKGKGRDRSVIYR